MVVLGVLAAPLATPGGPAAYALASKPFCLADAEPRDLGILVWELRNPRPRYDPPQLWHRYADLWVTYLCAPEAREAFAARLRVGE